MIEVTQDDDDIIKVGCFFFKFRRTGRGHNSNIISYTYNQSADQLLSTFKAMEKKQNTNVIIVFIKFCIVIVL